MNNEQLLFENVDAKCHCIGSYIDNKIRIKDKILNFKSLLKIIEHLKWMKKEEINYNLKIIIDSKNVTDQITVLTFESIVYYAMKYWNFQFRININLEKGTVGCNCFMSCLLAKFINGPINNKYYISIYEKEKIIERNKYRKICTKKEELSEIITDITLFLENLGIEDNAPDGNDISLMVSEIVENAFTHSKSPCIFSVIVLNDNFTGEKVVDIGVLDYSKIHIGDGIKEYILNEDLRYKYSKNNKIVLEAYNKHKEYFDDKYCLDDFCTVSAFQKHVTSRMNSEDSSGTGLTTLIQTLIHKSIIEYCYVSSGITNIRFKDEFLNLSEEGLIGFNKKNDYLNCIPDNRIVTRNVYNLNVNAFNLSFIFKGV